MLTILYSTFNEKRFHFLEENIQLFKSLKEGGTGVEVIFLDGSSTDGTLEFLQSHPWKVLLYSKSSRGERFQKGVEVSRNPMILFHHPRSLLSLEAIQCLQGRGSELIWGGFRHRFDISSHWLLTLTSWYSNQVRFPRGIVYLDHCLFAHRNLVERVGGFPRCDIFEDTVFSTRLRKLCSPTMLPFDSHTSSVRFIENGIFFQAFMNQLLKLGYNLGVSPRVMNRIYEKGLELNQKYR